MGPMATLRHLAGLAAAAIAAAGLATLGFAAPASAQEIRSEFIPFDLTQCTVMSTYEAGASFACPGYKGYPVWVTEGDLRFYVSYGFGAPEEKAAEQTFGGFNTLGPGIEWRLHLVDGEWVPFATILRWIVDKPGGAAEGEPDQFLVVTRIAPGSTCQVAHIDALRTEFANEAARQWADSLAPSFNCESDEIDRVPD